MRFLRFLPYLLFVLMDPIRAQSPFSADIDSLIGIGMDYTFQSRYDSAQAVFQAVIERHPDHPVGYFYQAAVLQSKMMDYETDRWEKEFYEAVNRAITVGKERIQATDDPWVFFYLGSSYGYKGLYQAKSGSLVSGFISAQKGLGHLRKSLELDSTLFDSHLVLGSYKYWAGRFYKYLRWLPFISDDRKEGLAEVKKAVDLGRFSYWVGLNNLAWIEFDRKQFVTALDMFDRGLTRYPGSRFFLWGKAGCLLQLNCLDQAVREYETLLSSIQRAEVPSPYNETVCRFKIVQCQFLQKRYEDALVHAEAILALTAVPDAEKRIRDYTDKTEEYRNRCLEALGRPIPKDERELPPVAPH
jgi:tetratricopeptide (TPR) repeat protein